MDIRIPVETLTAYCAEVFARIGCSAAEAGRVASSLVGANLTGHDSHGVIRVPRYVDWTLEGMLTPIRQRRQSSTRPRSPSSTAIMGSGIRSRRKRSDIGIAKAREVGLSAVALRNSGHLGRVGQWAELAAEAGLISIHFVTASGSVLVAPYAALERRFSTAPFCVGVPRIDAPPVVLDSPLRWSPKARSRSPALAGRNCRPTR